MMTHISKDQSKVSQGENKNKLLFVKQGKPKGKHTAIHRIKGKNYGTR
jgi:hypothetical protein